MRDPDDAPPNGIPEAVAAYRAKLDSITDITLPLTRALNKRIERARRAMGRPSPITGEEDTDPEIEFALEIEEDDDEQAPPTP